jgi:3-deoxy-D-manno-octulosonate 8-phosphate phosphatase (KDO 8-P phosphatase)
VTESQLNEKLAKTKMVAMDVDGTYTNGLIFYDTNGEVIKGFHAHDGFAIELLRLAGIKRGFITGRSDNATKARAEYLRVDFLLDNISDKNVALTDLLSEYGISPDECVFVGDDINDLGAFEVAGVSVAVANANHDVKKRADVVIETCGGSGAVREVVEMILRAKGLDQVELWNTRETSIIGKQ